MGETVGAVVVKAAVAIKEFFAAKTFISLLARVAVTAAISAALRKDIEFPEVGLRKDITTRGTIEPKKIVYGKAILSGPLAFNNTAGTDKQDLYQVVALTGHEIEDITDVWLDGDEILEANIDWGTDGQVNGGKFEDYAWFTKYLGTDTDTADAELVSTFTELTTEHRGRGISKVVCKFRLTEASQLMWEAGAPRNIRILVTGKNDIYDSRLEFDDVGTYGVDPTNVAYQAWTDNSAFCVADYLVDTKLGMKMSPSRLNWEDLATESDYTDTLVDIPVATTEKRFTTNGVLSTINTHRENLQKLLSAMNGRIGYSGGKFKITAGRYITPTITIDETWLRSGITINTAPPKEKRYNTVRSFFVDPDHSYKVHQAPNVTDAAFVTRDNNEPLNVDLELVFTNGSFMSQRIAFKQLQQSDEQQTLTLLCNYMPLQLAIHEQVLVTLPALDFDEETFRVANWSFKDLGEGEGGIDLVLKQDSAAAYDDPLEGEYSTITPAGAISFGSPEVPDVSGLTITAAEGGIKLQWTAPDRTQFYDVVGIYRHTSNDSGAATKIGEVRSTVFLDKNDDTTTYFYWVRTQFHEQLGSFIASTPTSTAGLAGVVTAQSAGSGINMCHPQYSSEVDGLVNFTIARAVVVIDPTESYFGTGRGVIKITPSAADSWAYFGASISDYNVIIQPNKKWILSYRVKHKTGTSKDVIVRIRTNAAGTHYNAIGTTSGVADTYTLVSSVIDLTSDNSTALIFRIDPPDADTSGDTYFDAIMFEEQVGDLTTPSAYSKPSPRIGIDQALNATANTGALADLDTVDTIEIDEDAVTSRFFSSVASFTTVTLADVIDAIDVPDQGVDHDAVLIATMNAWINTDISGGPHQILIGADTTGSGFINGTVQTATITATSSPGEVVALIMEKNPSDGDAWDYQVEYLGTSLGDKIDVRDLAFEVVLLKR